MGQKKKSGPHESIEHSLQRLEEIVESLEDEKTTLAEAVRLFEEGTQLTVICRKHLADAEMKVTTLRQQADNTIEEEDFTILNDS